MPGTVRESSCPSCADLMNRLGQVEETLARARHDIATYRELIKDLKAELARSAIPVPESSSCSASNVVPLYLPKRG